MAQSILIYGESGCFKSTQIALFARYQYARTGKITRLITCDSGFGPMQAEVDEGLIIPIRLESCKHPVPVLAKLSRGEWPTHLAYQGSDKEGIWATDPGATFASVVDDTGAYAVEGLTRICELTRMAWTDEQREMGEPLQGKYDQQGEKFAFQSRGTLFGVQQMVNNTVIRFRGLAVDRILFTAHESKGVDGVTKAMVLGPATTGGAQVANVPGWFEITLHHESFQYAHKKRDGQTVVRPGVRAFFQNHPDKQLKGMYWKAKLGVPAPVAARINDTFEDGCFPLVMQGEEYVSGLHTFLALVDNQGYAPNTELAEVAQSHSEYVPSGVGSSGEQVADTAAETVDVGVAETVLTSGDVANGEKHTTADSGNQQADTKVEKVAGVSAPRRVVRGRR